MGGAGGFGGGMSMDDIFGQFGDILEEGLHLTRSLAEVLAEEKE